MNNSSKT